MEPAMVPQLRSWAGYIHQHQGGPQRQILAEPESPIPQLGSADEAHEHHISRRRPPMLTFEPFEFIRVSRSCLQRPRTQIPIPILPLQHAATVGHGELSEASTGWRCYRASLWSPLASCASKTRTDIRSYVDRNHRDDDAPRTRGSGRKKEQLG